MRTLEQIDVVGRTVFVRVDFNVPLDENLHITDDARIRAALPTESWCMTSPLRSQVTVCSPVCGCGGTRMPPPTPPLF